METENGYLTEKTVNSYGVEDLLPHPRKPHQSKFLLTRLNRRASGTAVMFMDRILTNRHTEVRAWNLNE
jgi:hypothetical protein